MKFADALAVETDRPGPKCRTGILLEELPKDDAADLRAALADPTVAGSMIARALTKLGHPMQAQSIVRHRKGDCGCDR